MLNSPALRRRVFLSSGGRILSRGLVSREIFAYTSKSYIS